MNKRFGFVAVIDALGASGYDDSKIERFIRSRNRLLEGIKPDIEEQYLARGHRAPEIYTFGDTIIMTLDVEGQNEQTRNIAAAMILIKLFVYRSFIDGILFRGAFSIGDYFADASTNTVLGSAVADAASWHEQGELVGVFATPQGRYQLLKYFTGQQAYLHDAFFHTYSIPIKSSRKLNTISLGWPQGFFDKQQAVSLRTPRERFVDSLSRLSIPRGTEHKYSNTEAYFDFIESEFFEQNA